MALLKQEYPNWEFSRESGFDGVSAGISDDLGAVVGDHDYAMGKLRGAIFRNKSVSDDQRDRALTIFDDVKALIANGYALEGLLAGDDLAGAGKFYREQVLEQADQLGQSINELTAEIDQAIKFSAL